MKLFSDNCFITSNKVIFKVLIEQSENLVSKLLKDKLSRSYTYHNFKRTSNVVKAVITFADSEDITA